MVIPISSSLAVYFFLAAAAAEGAGSALTDGGSRERRAKTNRCKRAGGRTQRVNDHTACPPSRLWDSLRTWQRKHNTEHRSSDLQLNLEVWECSVNMCDSAGIVRENSDEEAAQVSGEGRDCFFFVVGLLSSNLLLTVTHFYACS